MIRENAYGNITRRVCRTLSGQNEQDFQRELQGINTGKWTLDFVCLNTNHISTTHCSFTSERLLNFSKFLVSLFVKWW